MFLGMAIVAWVDDFDRIGWITLAVLAGLTALSVVTDFAAGALGAKSAGASRIAFLGAALGALVGVFFGPIGLVLGTLVGALLGELITSQDVERATARRRRRRDWLRARHRGEAGARVRDAGDLRAQPVATTPG
jgi:uncharacterized protein YqgC (DUF456 family)